MRDFHAARAGDDAGDPLLSTDPALVSSPVVFGSAEPIAPSPSKRGVFRGQFEPPGYAVFLIVDRHGMLREMRWIMLRDLTDAAEPEMWTRLDVIDPPTTANATASATANARHLALA